MKLGTCADSCEGKSVLVVSDKDVKLHLRWRKNTDMPSVLTRTCWCGMQPQEASICPVHVFGAWAATHDSGAALFAGLTLHVVVKTLRSWLRDGNIIENPGECRPHDFRRGHVRDMQESGASLQEILLAGGWRGPGFMKYMHLGDLERVAVIQAHQNDSSEDEAEFAEAMSETISPCEPIESEVVFVDT